jgi:translocation and assembly module TamB
VLAVVCLLPLLLLAALGSEAGLRAALAAAQSLSGGAVQVATLDGSLASGNLRLRGVLARTALSEYQLDELALRWRPAALWRGRLDIDALELGVLRLRSLAPDPTPPSLPADLRLPLALHIEHLRLARLEVGSVALGPLLAKVDSDASSIGCGSARRARRGARAVANSPWPARSRLRCPGYGGMAASWMARQSMVKRA